MEDKILDSFDEDSNIKLVNIKSFYWESKAYLYSARLKEVGIPSFISNSNISSVLHVGIDGITLKVRETDVEAAMEIIQEMDAAQKDENESFHDADHEDIAYEKEVSETAIAIEDDRAFTPTMMVVFLLAIILLLGIWQGLKYYS